ncbi:MAG: family 78 glycoside hydrolase catalytic domain [Mariniphaga sp.]|nr:family 78 glycoside hydrolase catalytic domain [Mariniphaga sp.]
MKRIHLTLLFLVAVYFCSALPTNLKVNYLTQPKGIDKPVFFSWEVIDYERGAQQTAYRILVASSLEKLDSEEGDYWDSGKVNSSRTIQIPYQGKQFKPGSRYFWKVISWNNNDEHSECQENGLFETGLFSEKDWKGKWIGDGRTAPERDEDFYQKIPAPLFRKSFDTKKNISGAKLYISGLGYHEIYLNGEKISDYRLEPGWTQFAKTVYYNVHDVTHQLKTGKNALGVVLGNGWYNPLPLRVFNRNLREILTIGQPKMRCQLTIEYEDGSTETIASDRSWKTAEGPVVRNNVYLGEWYDARQEIPGWCTPEFDDSLWEKVTWAEAPEGKLTWQYIPPVRHTKTLHPVQLMEPHAGMYVYDLGQNFAGVIRFRVDAPAGTEIIFRYAEVLKPDLTIDVNTTAAGQVKSPGRGGPGAPDVAWQEDRYICKGIKGETFEPRFTYHGFRFVEVTGLSSKPSLNDLEGLVIHSDIPDVSEFNCSNGLFNQIQQITEWAMLSNVHSVESDCPAREKFGYGGDIVTVGEAFLYNYDMSSFYQKSVRDFERDALPSGGMTECAPNIGINGRGIEPGTGPVGWTLAHPFILYQLHKYYGNIEIVKEQYPALKKLVDFYHDRTPDFLILDCIGDHNSVDERPYPVSAASAYYHHVTILAELAELLGKKEDVKKYSQVAENIKKAFIERLVDKESGKVYSGYQASQVFALYYDLLPQEVRRKAFARLEEQIMLERQGHLTTGIFSTKMMLNYLSDQNRDDLSFIMLNQKEYPGYGYMIDNGATTLWENWNKKEHDSKNHPMFGSVSEWFYKSLLGIQQSEKSVAFSEIVIKPSVVGDLTWAKGSYHSVRGKISSSWWRFGNDLHLTVTIPANTTGKIYMPVLGNNFPDIYEGNYLLVKNGKKMDATEGISFDRLERDFAVFSVKSGTYTLVLRG